MFFTAQFLIGCVTAYEDDEWPEELGVAARSLQSGTAQSSSLPHQANGSAHELEGLKRFVERKRTDVCFYNMSASLAAVALGGFDIRRTNDAFSATGAGGGGGKTAAADVGTSNDKTTTADNAKSSKKPRESHIGNRRDAYLAAVRDNILHEASDLSELQQDFASASGFRHNTYHGATTRARPTVNFDVPMRFTETNLYDEDASGACDQSVVTSSNDNRGATTTPGTDGGSVVSAMTPGTSSYSGASSSLSPSRAGTDDYYHDMALISLSPSQDKQFIRQFSDTSSSAFETPSSTTPKSTPSRLDSLNQNTSVRFDEDVNYSPSVRSPAVKFSDKVDFGGRDQTMSSPSIHGGGSDVSSLTGSVDTPAPLPPPPSRRDSTPSHVTGSGNAPAPLPPPPSRRDSTPNRHVATAERPVTLDIIARPRRSGGILKKPSPAHHSNVIYQSVTRTTTTPPPPPTTVESENTGDAGPFVSSSSSRSGIVPPGSSSSAEPAREQVREQVREQRTLLDIDVEGQRNDPTQPLRVKSDASTVLQQRL